MLQTTTSAYIMPQKFNWKHSRRSDLKWFCCRNGGLDSQCQSRFRPRLVSNSVSTVKGELIVSVFGLDRQCQSRFRPRLGSNLVSVSAKNKYLDNIGFWP